MEGLEGPTSHQPFVTPADTGDLGLRQSSSARAVKEGRAPAQARTTNKDTHERPMVAIDARTGAGLVGRLWPVRTEGVPALASMLLRAPVFFRDSEVRVTGRHHVSGEGALENEFLHRPLGNGASAFRRR